MATFGGKGGEVRALLAFMVVGTLCYLCVWLTVKVGLPPTENPLIEWLRDAAGLILGFYFGYKAGAKVGEANGRLAAMRNGRSNGST